MITVKADFSDLQNLHELVATAVSKPHAVRSALLDKYANRALTEAAAIARSYPSPIDALADDVRIEGTPVSKRIFSNKREGFFLEHGSPNTGAPRRWLTGPAQKAADDLFAELSEAANPW